MDNTDDLENVLAHLGDFGKYQFLQFMLHLAASATAGVHMLSLQTVGAVPDHRCRIPGLDSLNNSSYLIGNLDTYIPKLEEETFDSCHIYNLTANDSSMIKCDSWIYDTTYHKSSRGMEWNFVCDRRWMGAVAQAVFMFGVFVGAVTLGSTADKYGRKPVFCWSAILQLVFGVAAAFIPEYYAFLIVQFFYGIFGSAGSLTGFVLSMELVGPSKRTVCGISFQAAFAIGIMLVAGWGALIPNRQTLQLVYGLHAVVLLGHWWWMDESLRWLWANNKKTEVIKIIQKGLRMNGSSIQLDLNDYFAKPTKANKDAATANIFDLFKMPVLRRRTLNICLAWFANSLVYYGLSLGTGKLYGNPFVLLCLVGVVELPGYLLTVLLIDRTGRRSLISLFMVLGGTCCIIAVYLFKGSVASTLFVMIGKFAIGSSFAIVYNYSAELFPTVVRNTALGLGSTSARISGILTPLVTLLDSLNPALPTTIFAVISIISGFLVLFLPETLGSSMPQTLQDGETFKLNDTGFTSCCGKKNKDDNKVSEQLEPLKSV